MIPGESKSLCHPFSQPKTFRMGSVFGSIQSITLHQHVGRALLYGAKSGDPGMPLLSNAVRIVVIGGLAATTALGISHLVSGN
jgi:hypothetical protein